MPGQFTGARGMAQEYISSLVSEGLTNAQIVGTLQDYGMGYRMQHMYSDVNRIRLEEFGAESIKGLDIYTPVPTNLMREWEGDTAYKYRVVIEYEAVEAEGGEIAKRATTIYYNRPPSVDEVLEDWGVRIQSLERGVIGSDPVFQVGEINRISYFYNIPKKA